LKPHPKEQEEKKIRAIAVEWENLRHQIQNPPSIRLKEPIQRGWIRHHVLTKEAQLRPDAPVLQQILEIVGTKEYHWRRNFIPGRRRRPLVEIKQSLRTIHPRMWRFYPDQYPEEWKPYFRLEYQHYWQGSHHYEQWVYAFNEAHLFELIVERHWLTHLSIIDPLLIERQAELEAWMTLHNGWNRHSRLKGHWARCRPRSSWSHRHEFDKQEKKDLRHFMSHAGG